MTGATCTSVFLGWLLLLFCFRLLLLVVSAEQGIDEIVRVELVQILDLLAHADKFHGNAELILYRYYYTTFCGSVKLCENNSCNFSTFTEKFGLIDCILSSSRVKNQ